MSAPGNYGSPGETRVLVSYDGAQATGSLLKFMPPGHFCPDVLGLEDLGEADFLRGRVVRGFFRLMQLWPHPRRRHR